MELRDKVRGLALDRKVAKVTLVGVPDRPGIARGVFEPLADAGINVDMIVQNVGHAGATDLSFTVPATELAQARRLLDPSSASSGFAEHDHRRRGGQGLDRRRGHPERAGLRRADVRGARRRGHQHRDDLDLGDPHHLHHRARTTSARRPRRCTLPSSSNVPMPEADGVGAAAVG